MRSIYYLVVQQFYQQPKTAPQFLNIPTELIKEIIKEIIEENEESRRSSQNDVLILNFQTESSPLRLHHHHALHSSNT